MAFESFARSRSAVVYLDRVKDFIDKSLFFVAFTVGAAASLFLKALAASQLAVTALPVATMFVYAGILFTSRRWRMREDQAGDNLYYLGFLFTLVSLACSLYQFNI